MEPSVASPERSPHYGLGTVVVGVLLHFLALLYSVEVAGVVRHTRYVLAHPLPEYSADGGRQLDLRTMAHYDFFITAHAWLLGHVWLVWVVMLHFARRPKSRLRLVRGLAMAFVAVAGVTWLMVLWLAGLGTSV
jgi:hypothetical protein